MARTYLLRTLAKWAKELQQQEPPEDSIPDNSASLSRRQFVAGLGAAGMLSAIPAWAKTSATAPRIAIIGAGIAGLSCALKLRDHRIQATLYEAAHRAGGRMFSNARYWSDRQVSEWCGELIDTGHKTILRLAKRFNLPVDDLLASEPENSGETYHFFGAYYTEAQAKQDFKAVYKALKADLKAAGYPTRYDSFTAAGYALDHLSVYDWIESRVPGGHAAPFGQLLDYAYNIEYGAETSAQSALNLIYLLAFQASANSFGLFGESDERFHIRGGNEQLPQAIQRHLGAGSIKFGSRLKKIARIQDGRYRLLFQHVQGNVTQELYDYVVLAIPFAVLREIDYRQAGFDALKHTAIQELGRGRNGKLQLQFTHRFWRQPGAWPGISNGSSYSDSGYQSSWEVSRAQAGNRGILVAYSGGNTAAGMHTRVPFATAANPQTRRDAHQGLAQLENVFPGASAAANGKITQSLPHLSPYFKASYAFYRAGQYTAFGGYEGVAQDRVLFCGEHTSTDFQGFMEGGASEGQRAARDLLGVL